MYDCGPLTCANSNGIFTVSGSGRMSDYSSSPPWNTNSDLPIIEVIIEVGVTSIGKYSFNRAESLQKINISNTVESIGDHAFEQCTSLTSICISPQNLFITPTQCTSHLDSQLSALHTIGSYTFCQCSSLPSIIIPDSVMSIEHSGFSYCSSLECVVLSSQLRSTGNETFSYCTNLTSIEIPPLVDTISNSTFLSCSSLQSVNLSNVTLIKDHAFDACDLIEIVFPKSVHLIYPYAFDHNDNLERITLYGSISYIGQYAFNSTKLKYVYYYAKTAPLCINVFGDNHSLLQVFVTDGYPSDSFCNILALHFEEKETADFDISNIVNVMLLLLSFLLIL